jgi:chorismate-pyruvate lyase
MTALPATTTAEGFLRIDLQQSLSQSHLDPRQLSPFQRILLTTDGTVTEILEAQYSEAIRIVKLFQGAKIADKGIPYLELPPGEVSVRKVLLRGKVTHRNYIYAESILVPTRLDPSMQAALRQTEKPIGQLMLEMRMESFREILSCRLEPAPEIGEYFDIAADARVISRTYRIFAGGKPIMLITEKFPESAFKD